MKSIKTIEEINAQADRLMAANETWYADAIRAGREPINRKAQIIAAWHNVKMAAKERESETTELSPAGYCLDIYLHNTREIYDRYTAPAIGQAVDCIKDNARCMSRPDFYEVIAAMTTTFGAVESAVYEAGRLVERYDRMKPKTKDIEQVTRNYAAYIVDCAKYEIETINA